MQIKTITISIGTKGYCDIVDITHEVQKVINENGLKEGNALVFVPGATAGVTTIEYEPGLLKDYPQFFEKLIPSNAKYAHDETWDDSNGFSHIRSSLQGASLTVPFSNTKLMLGTWQQIVLVDFDNRSRKRKVIIQLMGQ
ncbi:MAG: secondary thiamine-phosphate synthase enzyme YjbQ [Bacteroidetes bacterium]|nr:secondary thiamine-phosphate synthase enzyme YjbQ [Bacteroidota bacterium]